MIQFAAGPDGLAERAFSTDFDLSALDIPAFPLNFDPQELLAEVDAGSDPNLNLSNLQEMLELDIFGSPHAQGPVQRNAVSNAPVDAPLLASKREMASPSTGSHDSHQQATPGVYELFQLQHVAPDNVLNQQTQWPLQQQTFQQQVMQPAAAAATEGISAVPLYQQPYQQQLYQQQPPMQQQLPMQQQQQQFLSSMQQPQGQFFYLPPGSLQQQQQPLMLQQQQQNSFFLPSSMPQQTFFGASNGSFISPQPLYIPQQQPDMKGPVPTSPFLLPASFPNNLAGLQTVDQTLLPNNQLQPIAVPPAGVNSGSGSFSSPIGGLSFHGSGSGSGSGSGGLQAAIAAATNGTAAANGRKGRNKVPPASAVAGLEKPKGPSRRFRERQKETISTLEAEVTEKLAQLQALSAENEMLKLRSAVLEATVKGREYHIRVIEEHGPPVFDSTEERVVDVLAQLHPAGDSDSPNASHSGVSAGCLSSGLRGTVSDSEVEPACTTDGETATHGGAVVFSHTSSVCTAAITSPQAPTPVPLAPDAGGSCTDSLKCCDAPQMCSPAQQKKTINCLKHLSAEEIIRHWKQFLHDVTGELLSAEQEEQQEKLRRLAKSGKVDMEDDSTCTSALDAVGKSCRWCSGRDEDNADHTEENCKAAAEQRAAEQQPQHSRYEVPITAASCGGPEAQQSGSAGFSVQKPSDCQNSQRCTMTENRIIALVNKYCYMTKFVALLNPGVLYHLYGRHLDTGLAAPYTDDHWRQVVSRLGLSKHQVTVILACAELYFSSLSKLLEQRRMLQQQLKQADEGLSECQKRLRGVDGGINQLQVLDALASNLKREHVLRIMLNCFVWGRSLNSIQFAKSAVYSHPFFPDVHAMVCVLYEDARAMAPNGQPALVFPHRQHQQQQQPLKQESALNDEQQKQQLLEELKQQQQQQVQLLALREQLQAQSEELRLQALNAKSGGSGTSGLAL